MDNLNRNGESTTARAKRLIAQNSSLESMKEGKDLLQLAINKGCGEATEFAAIMLASGMMGTQNWNAALDYLALAASLGRDSACQQLLVLSDTLLDRGRPPHEMDWTSIRDSLDIESILSNPEKKNVSEEPRIRIFDNFLPASWCDWMMSKAHPGMIRARTYDDSSQAGVETKDRTNSAVSFSLLDLDLILVLVQSKMASILGVPMFAMEKPQIFQYAKGEEFREHHDFLDINSPAQQLDISQYGQRIATCLIYLNDDFKGGETSFPLINKTFRCSKGGALFFTNVDLNNDPDFKTLHAGLAPTNGEKWVFSQWIRSGPSR